MQWWSIILVILGIASLMLFPAQEVAGEQSAGMPAATLAPTNTPTPTATSVPIPTSALVPTVTYEQLLFAHKEVLESTAKAVSNTHETADLVLKIVAFVFTLLGAVGIGGAWWLSRTVAKAETALKQSAQAIEHVQSIETRAQSLEETYAKLVQGLDHAESRLVNLGRDLEHWKKSIERDREALKRSLELIQVDEHGMAVFGDDQQRKWKSTMALVEMSRRPDSVIRRRCARIFGALEEYDETVARRLEEMAESDPARGVRREAEQAIERLMSRRKST